MRRAGAAAPWLALLLPLAAACSDDGDKSSPDPDKQRDESPAEIEIDPDEYPTFDFSSLQLPYSSSDACIAHAKDSRNDTSAPTACMCKNCLERMQECDVLPGCTEIVQCSMKSGCKNEYDCYLLPFAPCTATVDKWGNASVATTVSLELMSCTQANACR